MNDKWEEESRAWNEWKRAIKQLEDPTLTQEERAILTYQERERKDEFFKVNELVSEGYKSEPKRVSSADSLETFKKRIEELSNILDNLIQKGVDASLITKVKELLEAWKQEFKEREERQKKSEFNFWKYIRDKYK